MASLLERMNVTTGNGTGPIRSKNGQSSRSSTPYNRSSRTPKGDVDSAWSHDLFESHNSLSARLNVQPTAPKASFTTIAQKALRDASAFPSELSIKGAGTVSQGNVVEVTGLVGGTTADDVAAIFKRCGVITNAKSMPGSEVKIRITFKTPSSAATAVQKFHNQAADGKTLSVRIVGSSSAGTTLGGRLGGADGLGLVRQEGSVDVLMDADTDSGSKMRSDSLLNSDRAQILVAPPGADPKDYTQTRGGSEWKRGRGGRGRRGRRGGNASRMDVD